MTATLLHGTRMPIALIGAGGIGRMHIERMQRHSDVRLAAVADPSAAARELAAAQDVPWFADYQAMLDAGAGGAAAVIVATPNATHTSIGLACIAQRLPMLMEKPIAAEVTDAARLCDAADAADIALLVGHQRRHNPILRRARELVQAGALGRPVSVSAMATWLKPDAYYELAWRREPGGGPVLINLIHDIDLLRFLLGDVVQVQAMASSAVRGFAVEDTASVTMRFACGALGALAVSDTAAAPWNWDLASGEAAHYPRQDVDSHYLCGTEGSLTLPRLQLWHYRGARGWHDPLTMERTVVHTADPYAEQLRHFRAVVEGSEAPLCSGRDGLATLRTVQALLQAAASGMTVDLST